jgi:hypothetical protein
MPPNPVTQGGAVDAVVVDRLLPKMLAMLRGWSRAGTWVSMPGSAALVMAAIEGVRCPTANAVKVTNNKMYRIM